MGTNPVGSQRSNGSLESTWTRQFSQMVAPSYFSCSEMADGGGSLEIRGAVMCQNRKNAAFIIGIILHINNPSFLM